MIDTEVIKTKKEEKWRREYMTLEMELQKHRKEGREEGLKEGIEKGMEKGLKEGENRALNKTAIRLLSMGLSVEDVVKGTGLSAETVEKIKANMEEK